MIARPHVLRKFAAGTAALALSATLVSCSDSGSGGDGGETSASETTSSAAEESGTEESGESTEAASTQVNTADGNTVLVSTALAEEIDAVSGDWGQPESVEESDAGSVATFAEGHMLVYSEETGAQPLVGMIGQTWQNDGGLSNPIGLPTAAEQRNEESSGWSQEFQNGTIEWVRGEDGEFTANTQSS